MFNLYHPIQVNHSIQDRFGITNKTLPYYSYILSISPETSASVLLQYDHHVLARQPRSAVQVDDAYM
jgi:hypothetical protein